jgi:hypothetical protein
VELDWEDVEDRPWDQEEGPGRLDSEPHRGPLIKTLGIISIVLMPTAPCSGGMLSLFIGLGLGITAWEMARRDLARMRAATMDRRGEALTRTGRTLGIIGTLLNAGGLLACGAFICFMFIWH